MIEDDGGFMRRETMPAPMPFTRKCEWCCKVISDGAEHGFCSDACRDENYMSDCEMQAIARDEERMYGRD